VNIEIASWEEGHFWCTHTLELGYETPKSLDRDTSFTRGLADHPDYVNREAIIRSTHKIWLEQRLLIDSILLTQKKLLEEIRQKVLQMSLSSPNPSLEVNRIVLMLSALPDTFVQEVNLSLNEKLRELSYEDTLSTATTQPPIPSPEEEKLKVQQLVVDLKTYIDRHNRQLLLEQEQNNLREELEEKIAAQVAMEKQFARKPREERAVPEPREDVQKMERITLEGSRIPIRPGSIRVVQNIYFEENTAVLKSYAENELQRLIEFLKKNATIAVEISAHTHTHLGHYFADLISIQRAAAVVDYLVEHGIDRNRLVAAGHGKKSPLILPDIYPAEQKINQRIEIRILN
jgi:outer membrane protein OmpA-like peptidoglycan-associated protein